MATTTIPYVNHKHIESGLKETSVEANSYTEYSIPFETAYSSAPDIVLTQNATYGTVANAFATISYVHGTPTTTGFKMRVYNNTASTRSPNVYWIAIGD